MQEAFTAGGMIATQFVKTATGWKISAMAWHDERPGLAIHERYGVAMASSRSLARTTDGHEKLET